VFLMLPGDYFVAGLPALLAHLCYLAAFSAEVRLGRGQPFVFYALAALSMLAVLCRACRRGAPARGGLRHRAGDDGRPGAARAQYGDARRHGGSRGGFFVPPMPPGLRSFHTPMAPAMGWCWRRTGWRRC
jgi:hypothetical protein